MTQTLNRRAVKRAAKAFLKGINMPCTTQPQSISQLSLASPFGLPSQTPDEGKRFWSEMDCQGDIETNIEDGVTRLYMDAISPTGVKLRLRIALDLEQIDELSKVLSRAYEDVVDAHETSIWQAAHPTAEDRENSGCERLHAMRDEGINTLTGV